MKFKGTALLTVAVVAAIGFADSALAASHKKLSFEQAWKLCKSQMDKDKIASSLTTNDRYLRGGSCMHMHGYNL